MSITACWIVLLIVLGLTGLAYARRWRSQFHAKSSTSRTVIQRQLKPRSPDDCPACRRPSTAYGSDFEGHSRPRPWREVKSRRGAPKRISTDGYACPRPTCQYYRVIDSHVHALVGDGRHGKTERIQTFRCQACGSTFSVRRDTPFYRLKTATSRVSQVLAALAEGLDVAAAERIFGHRHTTITTWLRRAGDHSTKLHRCCVRHLHLPHLQLDEIRTRLRSRTPVLWL